MNKRWLVLGLIVLICQGFAQAAEWNPNPWGVAWNGAGDLVIADAYNLVITDSAGNPKARLSERGNGPGQLNRAAGIYYHDQEFYVIDQFNRRVQVFSEDGTFLRSIGTVQELAEPWDIGIVDSSVVISDNRRNRLIVYDLEGEFKYYIGDYGSDTGQWRRPRGFWVINDHELLVADYANQRLQLVEFGPEGASSAEVAQVPGLCIDVCGTEENIYVLFVDKIIMFDRDYNIRGTYSLPEGIQGPRALKYWPEHNLLVLSTIDHIRLLPADLSSYKVNITDISFDRVTLNWRSLWPLVPEVTYTSETDQTSHTFRGETMGKEHTITISGLEQATRYHFQVGPDVRTIPATKSDLVAATTTVAPGYTAYITAPILIVVYTNGKMGADDIALFKEELERFRLFYWVNSYMSWNMEFTYVFPTEELKDPDWFVGPNITESHIERALRETGKRISDFTGVLVFTALGNWSSNLETPYRRQGLGGGAFGVPAPWPNPEYRMTGYSYMNVPAGSAVTWIATHEYHHQLDALHHESGFPEYAHADRPGDMIDIHGEHYDFNARIMRNLPREDWLKNKFGRLETAIDQDEDGVPDHASHLPLDEARFGSSPTQYDSTGGGLSDLELIMTSMWLRGGIDEVTAQSTPIPDPASADIDGDDLPNGDDPYPLYWANPERAKKTPIIDGVIDDEEWDLFYTMEDPDFCADMYLNWDNDYLYFACVTDRPGWIRLRLDGAGDGWWFGKDNYNIEVDCGIYQTMRYRSLQATNFQDSGSTYIIRPGDIKGAKSQQNGRYHLEMGIPKNEYLGFVLSPNAKIGVSVAFSNPITPRPWTIPFEPHQFFYIQLIENGE